MNMEWLEKYAEQIKTERKDIHCYIGEYQGEYYSVCSDYNNKEYIPIQGKLFLTPNKGNLFRVIDKEQDIEDCFDTFENNSKVTINEEFFPYIVTEYDSITKNYITYVISLKQIKTDIKTLINEFQAMSGAWEYNDGDYGCISIAKDELELCKGIANRYPFEYQYKPSEFNKNPSDYDEDWSDIKFNIDDFNNNNVNEDNYDKVDAVASDFKDTLIGMLTKLKGELEWFPPRFRYEFVELLCMSPQDRHSIRKNAEYFAENINEELTEKEQKQMFVIL